MSTRKYITEFIGLDLLRIILSISVVLRHYYHFYSPFGDVQNTNHHGIITQQPLYSILQPFYNHGQYAVEVFWLISGLIFYEVYHEEIIHHDIDFRKFAWLRITRLYPLHLVTLLIVAILQIYFVRQHGAFFAYQANDGYHFFLQLFFMGSWSPVLENSFNVPVWSVSIEVFVYILFFMITISGLTKDKGLYFIILVIVVLNHYEILVPFERCMLFFFCGCLLSRCLNSEHTFKTILLWYAGITIILFAYAALSSYWPDYKPIFDPPIVFVMRIVLLSSLLVLLFIAAFRSLKNKRVISIFRSLGNMTYSLYLVHFPIQIALFLAIRPDNYTIFDSPLMLVAFLTVSLLTGWLVFTYFEKPFQQYLRKFNT